MKKLFVPVFTLFFSFILSQAVFAQNQQSRIQNPCDFPTPANEAHCCAERGGTWVKGGSGGFCYEVIAPKRLSSQVCLKEGGVEIKLNDGSSMCVPKGVKVLAGSVSQIDNKSKTMILNVKNSRYTFYTNALTSFPIVGQFVDVFYTDQNGQLIAKTTLKSSKSNSND